MRKIKFTLAFLLLVLYLLPTCIAQDEIDEDETCLIQNYRLGVISKSNFRDSTDFCWRIEIPENTYVRLTIEELKFGTGYGCSEAYVRITETGKTYTYKDIGNWQPFIAFGDVTIIFSNYCQGYYAIGSFRLSYYTEDLICVARNHFRCSPHSCIRDSRVCDGVKDCEDGTDELGCEKGVLAVKGVNITRENIITWLRNQRSDFFGWRKNTHRAVTALYLAEAASFRGQDLEEELIVKQLELQTSLALLRNSSDPISVSELSMFVNALTVICHNPRQFFGHDLVHILGERVYVLTSPMPGAYLTLCSSNWTLSESDISRLLDLLLKHSEYPFELDVQAVTVLALTCVKNLQAKEFVRNENASDIYNTTVEKFIAGQLADGSFGNVHTTALITQALIASGQENNSEWNMTSTMQYLMKELNSSSVDFLSAYLTLPIFSGRSLVDIKAVDCANSFRKLKEDDISDVKNKLGGKTRVQYSLYIGDQKDVIHTIFLRVPEKSSAYEVMMVAQVADPKYKFHHTDVSGHMYIYEIAGVINDSEAGKFWLLYSGNDTNGTIEHYTESPDKFILGDEEHLIMWFKTAHI